MDSKKIRSNLYLIIAALIWGFAFVAQSKGLDYVGPFTFNAVRCLLGGVALLPFAVINSKKNKKYGSNRKDLLCSRKNLLSGGLVCGTVLCVASGLQQYGLVYTSVGKAGFITALYMVIVPLLGIFTKKRVSPGVWVSVAIAVAGMYLLCINENTPINKGDAYTLLCALCFAFHILSVGHFASRVDGVSLSCAQFFVCAALTAIPMLLFESPDLESIKSAGLPIMYAGFLSSGVAYTFQILGQKHTAPSIASLIMSLESVFALLGGALLMGERLHLKEFLGCVLVFAAIILSQIEFKVLIKKFRKRQI